LEACKHKKRNRDGGRDDFLLTWNIDCTKHAADFASKHRDYHRRFCEKVLQAKGGLHPKYKLGILLNLNVLIQEKAPEKWTFNG